MKDPIEFWAKLVALRAASKLAEGKQEQAHVFAVVLELARSGIAGHSEAVKSKDLLKLVEPSVN